MNYNVRNQRTVGFSALLGKPDPDSNPIEAISKPALKLKDRSDPSGSEYGRHTFSVWESFRKIVKSYPSNI